MASCPSPDDLCGWVSGSNVRGTLDILYSSLCTVWLCTWTSLCLNIPDERTRGWRFLLYKFRWQLFTIFFPEVLVALAAEQWISARQSIPTFKALGHDEWTIRHGFFADMGGIMVAPLGGAHGDDAATVFAVDSYQLAYLEKIKVLVVPRIDDVDIKAINKADGLARSVTMGQMAWFCLFCAGRGIESLAITPMELETLAFILCTIHTFFFWWHKPLDPARPIVIPMNATVEEVCQWHREAGHTVDPEVFERTPLDFIRPAPDSKSLIAPFWFGLKCIFDPVLGRTSKSRLLSSSTRPRRTIANSIIHPAKGIGWGLTIYLLFFQAMYYGLHIGVAWKVPFPSHLEFILYKYSNVMDLALIIMFVLALPLGAYYAPFIGRFVFKREASTVLEVAAMLPTWGKILVHGPFVVGYIMARMTVLIESIVSLRGMPAGVYTDLDWSNIVPHI